MNKHITVSAPGSTLVTGEHAVIYGAPAVVAAIEQRATVHLRFTTDKTVSVTSQIAPDFQAPLEDVVAEGPYRFVLACVLAYKDQLSGGLEIDIQSEINHTLGLGSSAAVTVAMLAALTGSASEDLHVQALKIIRDLQGRGSGADLAASLLGGVLSYQIDGDGPAQMRRLPSPPQMSLFNVGYKTPTPEVLALVAAAREKDPDGIDAFFKEMTEVSEQTIDLMSRDMWAEIGPHLAAYQDLMRKLGVSDDALEAAVARAEGTSGMLGVKISGSGLGDCVLAIGAVPQGFQPVDLAQEGVVFHENA